MSKLRGRRDPWIQVGPKTMGHRRLQCTSEYDPSEDCPAHPGRCCVQCDRRSRCRLPVKCGPGNDDCYNDTVAELEAR